MKILIAPGAFKHSLGAMQAAQAIERGLARSALKAETRCLPIADGGNGTLDAWLAVGGERVRCTVHDPLMRPVEAEYGLLADGRTAVIEMALASGLELLSEAEHDPLRATTYGTGELMAQALARGARRFILGMGGSATVDGGAGALQALGVRLLNAHGEEIAPGGGPLAQVAQIDATGLHPAWGESEMIIATDVDNPLLGVQGAAAIFGPQKGASPQDVITLDGALGHFFGQVAAQGWPDVRAVAGSGAAGGLSAGLLAFLGGRIESGIDLLLEHLHFEEQLSDTDVLITGEGRMDQQTLRGKGPIGLGRLAQAHGVPVIALVGGLDVDAESLRAAGVSAAFSIVPGPMALADALQNAERYLEESAAHVGAVLALGTQGATN